MALLTDLATGPQPAAPAAPCRKTDGNGSRVPTGDFQPFLPQASRITCLHGSSLLVVKAVKFLQTLKGKNFMHISNYRERGAANPAAQPDGYAAG